jgi:hypothetical protein
MKTKKKPFDCVEMKNRAQRELMKEYEARRGEFASYVDFLNATADADPRIKAWRKKLRLARQAAKS